MGPSLSLSLPPLACIHPAPPSLPPPAFVLPSFPPILTYSSSLKRAQFSPWPISRASGRLTARAAAVCTHCPVHPRAMYSVVYNSEKGFETHVGNSPRRRGETCAATQHVGLLTRARRFIHALPDSEMYTTEYNSWSASRGRYLEKKHILIASFLGI